MACFAVLKRAESHNRVRCISDLEAKGVMMGCEPAIDVWSSEWPFHNVERIVRICVGDGTYNDDDIRRLRRTFPGVPIYHDDLADGWWEPGDARRTPRGLGHGPLHPVPLEAARYNSGMSDSDHSHRRAVWLIAGLLLALFVVVAGYELNWIRARQKARADAERDAEPISPIEYPDEKFALLPARGPGYLDRLAMWALDQPDQTYFVRCLRDEAELPTAFDDGAFPLEPIEKLEQVRRARWLFPEAQIFVEHAEDSTDEY
jgi:hypothetical protein